MAALEARLPMRTTASSTIASTAALRPKNSADDRGRLAEGGVEPAQRHDRDDAGQDEQPAGDEAAARAVQQPADIGGELLRLRAGQQHAVVERVQEAALGDPALLLDQDAVHDRDLAGRPAEAQERDAQPDAERLGEGRDARTDAGGLVRKRLLAIHAPALFDGQLWVSSLASRHQR